MDFEKPDIVKQLSNAFDDFVERELVPLEQEYEKFLGEDAEMHIVDGPGTEYVTSQSYLDMWQEVREKSADLGIYTMHMPEEVGGGGLDLLSTVCLLEHIENRNPSGFHSLTWEINVNETLLPAFEDDFQREKYFEPAMAGTKLPATAITEPDHGSDANNMDTSATRDGDNWVLDGKKSYITKGAICDFATVFARTGGDQGDTSGITAFLIDSDNPGFEVEKVQRSMGEIPGVQAILNFDGCRVPQKQVLGEVGNGFEYLTGSIGDFRMMVAAEALGHAQWLLDTTIDYASQRKTWGIKIGQNQGIQFPIAELATDLEQARLLCYNAARKEDRGERAIKEQSMAKLRATNAWTDIADLAIQVHGAAGYMRSLPLEKEYREARGTRIKDGTDEIQKRTIAKELFGQKL